MAELPAAPTGSVEPKYFCGIDWHIRSATLCVADRHRNVLFRGNVSADAGAVAHVLERYRPHALAAVEATHGADQFADDLTAAGITCLVGHPAHLQAAVPGRGKSDRRDAERIAILLSLGEFPHTTRVRPDVRMLKSLLRQRSSLSAARQGIRSRASLRNPCRHGFIPAGREGGGKTGEKSHLSPAGVAAACDADTDANLTASIDRLEGTAVREAERLFADTFPRLVTIPGVGPLTAAALCAEIGDLARFRRVGNLLGYAGLAPLRDVSAGKTVRLRDRKACNPHLKKAFFQAAHFVFTHCPRARAWLSCRQTTSSPNGAGLASVARRLAAAVFQVWKRQVDYNPALAFPTAETGRAM